LSFRQVTLIPAHEWLGRAADFEMRGNDRVARHGSTKTAARFYQSAKILVKRRLTMAPAFSAARSG
jgi:hypothetical protein